MMTARTAPPPDSGSSSMMMIGGVVVVVVVGVIIYLNYGHHSSAPAAPSPPPPPKCPHQEKCGVGCYPTGTKCSGTSHLFSSASSACAQVNCCSGEAEKQGFLGVSGVACKDQNDGHYPCTCNGVLMNSSGVKSNQTKDGGCSIM